MKNILGINGSASQQSSNLRLLNHIAAATTDYFNFHLLEDLSLLPHFNPELSVENTPAIVTAARQQIEAADGVIVCTPEYVYSIPSGLKNLIEWCVATTVFSEKPVGLITAAADGKKGHEELQLLMKTIQAKFTTGTTLLVPGIKGKIDADGKIIYQPLLQELLKFTDSFKELVNE